VKVPHSVERLFDTKLRPTVALGHLLFRLKPRPLSTDGAVYRYLLPITTRSREYVVWFKLYFLHANTLQLDK